MFEKQIGQKYIFLLASKKDWLEDNPEAADKMIAAMTKAADWANSKPEAALAIVKKRFGQPEDYVPFSWGGHRFVCELPQALLTAMDGQARWMIRQQLVKAKEIPNFLKFINIGPLSRVNPSAIAVVR